VKLKTGVMAALPSQEFENTFENISN